VPELRKKSLSLSSLPSEGTNYIMRVLSYHSPLNLVTFKASSSHTNALEVRPSTYGLRRKQFNVEQIYSIA
jgi:hypothetical protein